MMRGEVMPIFIVSIDLWIVLKGNCRSKVTCWLTQPSPVYIAQMLPTSFPSLDNFSSTQPALLNVTEIELLRTYALNQNNTKISLQNRLEAIDE